MAYELQKFLLYTMYASLYGNQKHGVALFQRHEATTPAQYATECENTHLLGIFSLTWN